MTASIETVAEALQHRSDWASSDGPIEKRQTHISIVLLGRRNVLKLKKPVDFGFLDYSSLGKRRLACEAEVALNRRLCPEAYLGVRSIIDADGAVQLAEATAGNAIDYGVWMARLPEDRMLDRMVRAAAVTESIIDSVARRLSEFFRSARRGPEIDVHGSPEAIAGNWAENFRQITPFVGRTISRPDLEQIRSWVSEWMKENDSLLRQRASQHRIVDGHGDVRCESICVTGRICIFDCVEFNERFRCNDPASEAAFLAVDLDSLGRPDLGYYFTDVFAAHSSDPGIWDLLPFFRCYRAFVRAKVHSFVTVDPGVPREDRDRAAETASSWANLAKRYASPLSTPSVIAVCGFSGTGKTSLARAIAGELGLRVVSSDDVRGHMFGEQKRPEPFGQGVYGPGATQAVYRRMMEIAAGEAARRSVVLDGTFRGSAERELASSLAGRLGAELRVVQCQLSPEIVHHRLDDRARRKNGNSDATWTVYEHQRHLGWLGWNAAARLVDTSGPLAATAAEVAEWLRR